MTKRPENPILVAMNLENKKFWNKAGRLVEKRVNETPSAAKVACDQISDMIRDGVPAKWIPSFESLVLGGSDSLDQSMRGSGQRRNTKGDKLDEFDNLAIEIWCTATERGLSPSWADVWSTMVDRISNARADVNLEVEDGGKRIVLHPTPDGDTSNLSAKKPKVGGPRSIAKSSFKTIFSNLKRRS